MSNHRLSPAIIVVVGRQFGSGGRRLGLRLAKELGLAYYDKEVLTEAAQRRGFSREIFASHDEKRPSPLRSLISHAFGVADTYQQNPMSCEAIYDAQSRVIEELAEEGGCVFVGRSADYILRNRSNLASIFLHAPVEHRARILMERGEVPTVDKGIETALRQDRKREEYYNYFTGRKWGHADNYHLSLDTSLLSDDELMAIIRQYICHRFGPVAPSESER